MAKFQQNTSIGGSVPAGQPPSAGGLVPSAGGNVPSAGGLMPSAGGNVPSAGGLVPSSSSVPAGGPAPGGFQGNRFSSKQRGK